MPLPKKLERQAYRFTDDITFFQKAVILHPEEEKFLIARRSDSDKIRPGTWDLPGGNITYGELNIDGIRREVFEEVQLELAHIHPVHMITYFDETRPMYYIVVGFRCQALATHVKLSHEHSEFQWITKDDFLNRDPQYRFKEDRIFEMHKTDYLRDIVYRAFQQTK